MSKRVKIGLFTGLVVLAVAGLIAGLAWISRPKPVNIDMGLPLAVEAQALVWLLTITPRVDLRPF